MVDVGVAGGEESGGEQLTPFGEQVAMGFRDLANDAVGAKEASAPGDLGGTASLLVERSGERSRVNPVADVAVAETGRGKLAPRDGVKEAEVLGVANAQGAESAAVVDDGTGDGIEDAGARVGASAAA